MKVTAQINFEPADIREEILDAAELELRAIGLEMERDIVAEIDRMGLNVDGDLRKSVTSEVRRELLKVKLEAGPGAKHAEWVHDGTGPAVGRDRYFPPRAPIERWVKKKGLALQKRDFAKRYGYDSKELRKTLSGDYQEALDDVVRRVQFGIYVHGTKPKPYLNDVWALYRNVIADRVRDRILREVA